jgi:hypothetical protein
MKLANKDKLKKDDRILEVKVLDGEKPLSSIGMVDKRIFQGGNKLHAFYNPMTGFWKLRYEVGVIPGKLMNNWLSFDQLLADTDKYLRSRNMYISEVLD